GGGGGGWGGGGGGGGGGSSAADGSAGEGCLVPPQPPRTAAEPSTRTVSERASRVAHSGRHLDGPMFERPYPERTTADFMNLSQAAISMPRIRASSGISY